MQGLTVAYFPTVRIFTDNILWADTRSCVVLATSHAEVAIAVLSYDRIRLGVARHGAALVTGQFVKVRAFKCTPTALENIVGIVWKMGGNISF